MAGVTQTALGARSADIDVEIALIGEAVYLLKDAIANSVNGVGFPPFKELLEKAIATETPIWV